MTLHLLMILTEIAEDIYLLKILYMIRKIKELLDTTNVIYNLPKKLAEIYLLNVLLLLNYLWKELLNLLSLMKKKENITFTD